MKKVSLAIMAIMIIVVGVASIGHAKIRYTGEYVLANAEQTPSAATVSNSNDADAKIRELREENRKLRNEIYGKKGLKKRLETVEGDMYGKDGKSGMKKKLDDTAKQTAFNKNNIQYLFDYLKYFSFNYNKTADVVNETAKAAFTTAGAILMTFILLIGLGAIVYGISHFFERRRNRGNIPRNVPQ